MAPSEALRRWYGRRPERWEEFQARYRDELAGGTARAALLSLAGWAREGPLTLVFSARDPARSQAAVIREALAGLLAKEGGAP